MNPDPRPSSARRLRLALLAGLAVLAAPGGEAPAVGAGATGASVSHDREAAAVLPRAVLSWPAPPSFSSPGGHPMPPSGRWAGATPTGVEDGSAARPLDSGPPPRPFFERVSYRTTAPPLPAA